MKKVSKERQRIDYVIQADKSVMTGACKALVLQDFSERFCEYFDLNGLPRMEISCKNGVYTVGLAFEAERIKKFNVLK